MTAGARNGRGQDLANRENTTLVNREVFDPPCMRHNPFAMAGARHGRPPRVQPLHRRAGLPTRKPIQRRTRRIKSVIVDCRGRGGSGCANTTGSGSISGAGPGFLWVTGPGPEISFPWGQVPAILKALRTLLIVVLRPEDAACAKVCSGTMREFGKGIQDS